MPAGQYLMPHYDGRPPGARIRTDPDLSGPMNFTKQDPPDTKWILDVLWGSTRLDG